MIKFALCALLGVIGHQSTPVFDSIERGLNGNGLAWPRLGRYAVGGILIRISTLIMLRGVRLSYDEKSNIEIVGGAMSSGMIALGAGVSAGYVLDKLKE